jgi:hypothetical protein
MRWLVAALVAAALALPASAASVDPRLFVLHQIDVPPRYEFDEDNSLLISPADVARVPGEAGKTLARSGFVTAFYAPYTNYGPPYWRYVNSAAFVFRQPNGARGYLPVVVKSWFSNRRLQARRVDLGDEALLYTSSSRTSGTAVVWRQGRVVAFVGCSHMAEHRALALAQARKQQRRIASELK